MEQNKQNKNEPMAQINYTTGPYIITGDFSIVNADGIEIHSDSAPAHLCSCGKAADKIFCDNQCNAVTTPKIDIFNI